VSAATRLQTAHVCQLSSRRDPRYCKTCKCAGCRGGGPRKPQSRLYSIRACPARPSVLLIAPSIGSTKRITFSFVRVLVQRRAIGVLSYRGTYSSHLPSVMRAMSKDRARGAVKSVVEHLPVAIQPRSPNQSIGAVVSIGASTTGQPSINDTHIGGFRQCCRRVNSAPSALRRSYISLSSERVLEIEDLAMHVKSQGSSVHVSILRELLHVRVLRYAAFGQSRRGAGSRCRGVQLRDKCARSRLSATETQIRGHATDRP
jgi:hypothetical protein